MTFGEFKFVIRNNGIKINTFIFDFNEGRYNHKDYVSLKGIDINNYQVDAFQIIRESSCPDGKILAFNVYIFSPIKE